MTAFFHTIMCEIVPASVTASCSLTLTLLPPALCSASFPWLFSRSCLPLRSLLALLRLPLQTHSCHELRLAFVCLVNACCIVFRGVTFLKVFFFSFIH